MDFIVEYNLYFLLLLPIVSFLYATVGHGGASGYLALMALFTFPVSTMKPTALLLNLFVAGISFYHYAKEGHFNKKLFFVFAITSIPMSFLGGLIEVDVSIYKKTLAFLLIFSILKMLNLFGKESTETKNINTIYGLLVGAIIGFFSGLIGIGGGIILSPIILLMNWGKMKEAAAVSALFIWVNSAAGMTGQLVSGVEIESKSFILVSIALLGGFAGSYLGAKKMNNNTIKYILAFVLFLACLKLFFT